jgi:hypothetical protein
MYLRTLKILQLETPWQCGLIGVREDKSGLFSEAIWPQRLSLNPTEEPKDCWKAISDML